MRNMGRFTLGTTALLMGLSLASPAFGQDSRPGGGGAGGGGSGGMGGGGQMGDDKGAGMNTGRTAAPLPHKDREFIDKAAMGGLLEVKLGQLAASKAQNPAVKQFAQQMVDDHTKVNDQLKGIAQEKGVMMPTQLDGKAQAEYDRLSKMEGQEFDRAYMKRMVEDHDNDVSEFQKEADNGKDPQLKQFARQALPTLKQHQETAKRDRKML